MEANITIINDLKEFIRASGSCEELRKLFTSSESDFTRQRKLSFERLVLLLLNFFKRSYSVEIAEFFTLISHQDQLATKSAFCQQRMKINEIFFICLNEILVKSFYREHASEVKKWQGLRVIAVDGTTIGLFHQLDVIHYFGAHRNQNKKKKISPMAKAVSAFDVLNQITLKAELYPFHAAEAKVAQQWLPYYDPDMLLIYDRGFVGFNHMFLHQSKESPQPFLIRVPVRFTHEIRAFVESGSLDAMVSFRAGKHSSDLLLRQGFIVPPESTLDIRLIRVLLPDGTIEILATNLFDTQKYPQTVFKDLYFMRWGIETNFEAVKNKLQLESFSGQKVRTIMQDFQISFFLANLQEIIAKSCHKEIAQNNTRTRLRYQINRNIAFGVMKNRIVELFFYNQPEVILKLLERMFQQHLTPIRPFRNYPRVRKHNKSERKYQTLTNYKRAI